MPWWLYIIVIAAIYVAAFKLNGLIWPWLRKVYALFVPHYRR